MSVLSYREALKARLKADEGCVDHAYQDHLGYWTIGVGRLIDERRGGRLSPEEIDFLLENDIAGAERDARDLVHNFDEMEDARKVAVVSMAFQMGKTRLAQFTNTLKAMNDGRWSDAAAGMRNSLWAQQTPERAERLAKAMETGNLA